MSLPDEEQTPHQGSPALPVPCKAHFQYAGNGSSLSVTGPVTGVRYLFDGPGAIVEVDDRDRVLLASNRQLRQVRI